MTTMIFGGYKNNRDNEMNSELIIKIKKTIEVNFNHLLESATTLELDSILSFYSDEVSAIEQEQMHLSTAEFKASYRAVVETIRKVHSLEITNTRMKVINDHVVIYEAIIKQDFTLRGGVRINASNIITLIYVLLSEEWKIVHYHGSFMNTAKV